MATEPQVSTGEIATTSNPATPVGTVTVTAAPAEFNDTGTNAPVVTLQQSQTTTGDSKAVAYNPDAGISSADLGTTAFIAQPDPNAGISSADLGTTAFIAPQGKPAAAAAPADAGPKVPTSQNPKVQPGRNKFFTNDYYLDDVEIETAFATTAGGPTNISKIEFKITEPNGMTLLFNLNNAIRDLYNQPTAAINIASFVMVIRFYGWDEKGNLVTKVAPVAGTPGTVPNTSNAVVTKYFPFQLNKLTFKNAGKAVDYHAEGTALAYSYAQSSALGTVPEPLQLVGETVEQILNGTVTTATVSGDDSKRKTAPSAPIKVKDMSTREQAAIAAGTDPNAVNDQGMAFGGGGLSGA